MPSVPDASYTVADIAMVEDHVAAIRRRPQLHLHGGRFRPEDVASTLAEAALFDGVQRVTIERAPAQWWIVWSPTDWLAHYEIQRLFTRVTSFPKAGPNSMRPEILLTAFAADVVTYSRGELSIIKGVQDLVIEEFSSRYADLQALIGFRCGPEPRV